MIDELFFYTPFVDCSDPEFRVSLCHRLLRRLLDHHDFHPTHRTMGKLLSDVPGAGATRDRLLHHAEIT
jgi:hypothetical protein